MRACFPSLCVSLCIHRVIGDDSPEGIQKNVSSNARLRSKTRLSSFPFPAISLIKRPCLAGAPSPSAFESRQTFVAFRSATLVPSASRWQYSFNFSSARFHYKMLPALSHPLLQFPVNAKLSSAGLANKHRTSPSCLRGTRPLQIFIVLAAQVSPKIGPPKFPKFRGYCTTIESRGNTGRKHLNDKFVRDKSAPINGTDCSYEYVPF